MEAKKMLVVAFMLVVLMALSAINGVSASDAPAPAPTSDATAFLPTFLASVVAMAFALLF
ncbi:arabinogalactan protein 14 [Perilla frutescens var. frutescens]|nr:arabinogalactan protein 14 [Perilla frutescens var. frutescens]